MYTEPVTNADSDEDYQDFADRTVPKTLKQSQQSNDVVEVNTAGLEYANDAVTVTAIPV